jgi:hypothetical protein
MITESDIEDALDEVQENELAAWLVDQNQFNELADRIAQIAVNESPVSVLYGNIQQLVNLCRDHHWKVAERVAQDKDDAHRFQCEMKDAFDDYQWRTA